MRTRVIFPTKKIRVYIATISRLFAMLARSTIYMPVRQLLSTRAPRSRSHLTLSEQRLRPHSSFALQQRRSITFAQIKAESLRLWEASKKLFANWRAYRDLLRYERLFHTEHAAVAVDDSEHF
jgi:hypothetical protein